MSEKPINYASAAFQESLKRNKGRLILIGVIVFVVIVLLSQSLFVVGEAEQSVVSRFGVITRIILNKENDFHDRYAELLKNENALRGDSLPALTADSVVVHYEVYYYTNLGTYVNSADGSIACSDSIFGGDCTTHKGNIFLAWNMHSKKGRLVGTGAYVAHLTLKVTAGSKVIARSKDNSVWGVRRTSSK